MQSQVIGSAEYLGRLLGSATQGTLTIVDTDAAVPNTSGLAIIQTDGSTQVTEGGVTDTCTVALSSAPSSNVTVTVAGGSMVLVSSGSSQPSASLTLTFTPTTWNVPQVVTVTAVQDGIDRGAHFGTITFSRPTMAPVMVQAQVNSVFTADFNGDQIPDLLQIDRV
jgi:hypothetical protein